MALSSASAYNDSVNDWDGAVLHVDFTPTETIILKDCVRAVLPNVSIQRASSEELQQVAARAILRDPFLNRSVSSIFNFLQDMARREAHSQRQMQRLTIRYGGSSLGRTLRERELGHAGHKSASAINQIAEEALAPVRLFKAMSSDVNTLAWAPNSKHFAVGSAALTDEHSMQYNQAVNMVFGDAENGHLKELPQHMVPRRPALQGANATESMHNSQEPYLFTTISCLEFSKDGSLMFSGGYDNFVRLWSVDGQSGRPSSQFRVDARSRVDAIAVGPSGTFAVANQSLAKSIKLYTFERSSDNSITTCKKASRLEASFAQTAHTEAQIYPSCLRWAPTSQNPRYLLGGFASKDDSDRRGETCLWDVEQGQTSLMTFNKRAVFDIAWSQNIAGRFVVGCTPSANVNRGTRSVVRLYDIRHNPLQNKLELECPALDINDVIINPSDENLVCTGCTDGKVYLWDLRAPDRILHTFEHGKPVAELDERRPREESDTGIRFLSWNQTSRLLYSGSSDGIVSVWNPYLSDLDAHQYNPIQMDSGIMAAKFSPDYSHLLVGDVQGSILQLSTGAEQRDIKDTAPFDFDQATSKELADSARLIGLSLETSHVKDPARELLETGQITIQPFGDFPRKQAVQGPRYQGPYDNSPEAGLLRIDAQNFQQKALHNFEQSRGSSVVEVGFADDINDAGHWKERIPERLRRTRAESSSSDLTCFRCGPGSKLVQRASTATDVEELELLDCEGCGHTWRPDILGYQLVSSERRPRVKPAAHTKQLSGVSSSSEPPEGYEDLWSIEEVMEGHHDLWEVDPMTLSLARLSM